MLNQRKLKPVNYYEALSVNSDASPDEIKAAGAASIEHCKKSIQELDARIASEGYKDLDERTKCITQKNKETYLNIISSVNKALGILLDTKKRNAYDDELFPSKADLAHEDNQLVKLWLSRLQSSESSKAYFERKIIVLPDFLYVSIPLRKVENDLIRQFYATPNFQPLRYVEKSVLAKIVNELILKEVFNDFPGYTVRFATFDTYKGVKENFLSDTASNSYVPKDGFILKIAYKDPLTLKDQPITAGDILELEAFVNGLNPKLDVVQRKYIHKPF